MHMQISVTTARGAEDVCLCVHRPLHNKAFHLAPKKCDGQH